MAAMPAFEAQSGTLSDLSPAILWSDEVASPRRPRKKSRLWQVPQSKSRPAYIPEAGAINAPVMRSLAPVSKTCRRPSCGAELAHQLHHFVIFLEHFSLWSAGLLLKVDFQVSSVSNKLVRFSTMHTGVWGPM